MTGSRISVILPTHNGARTLPNCLAAVQRALGPHDEIVVVDDASSDNSGGIAQGFGCRLIRLEKNLGAAAARNHGAREAQGDILFFTDDDVEVGPDTLTQLRKQFADPKVDGVMGILAEKIPFPNFASNQKNLWMRFSYLNCPAENVGLFFTSAAAIRKEAFAKVGGFDLNYSGASIAEDTDLGQRALQLGLHLRIDRSLTIIHHKHYSVSQVLRTDFQRARALTHMRLRKSRQPFFTSVPYQFQLAVPTLGVACLCLLFTVFFPEFAWLTLLLMALFYGLVAPWLLYLFRTRGVGFGMTAALFQPIDSFAVGLGVLSALCRHLLGKRF